MFTGQSLAPGAHHTAIEGATYEADLAKFYAGSRRQRVDRRPGRRQKIRIVFAEPQTLRRISLVFEETARQRTQEFTLRASRYSEGPFVEIVRQQWTFSPPATVREAENYDVDLSEVAALELAITPEISGGSAHTSLNSLRLY